MKTKKNIYTIFALAVFAFLFVACATNKFGTKYKYDYGLIKNDSSVDSSSVMTFTDDKIDASFAVGLKSISFTIKNKTDDAMKIIWDESSIVQFGKTHKVMHSGVKYIDRNGAQTPSIIPAHASIDDIVLPTDNIYYLEGTYSQYYSNTGGWKERDLFSSSDLNKEEFKNMILSFKGQKFSLYLPIQTQGKTLDYNFNFIVRNVEPIILNK